MPGEGGTRDGHLVEELAIAYGWEGRRGRQKIKVLQGAEERDAAECAARFTCSGAAAGLPWQLTSSPEVWSLDSSIVEAMETGAEGESCPRCDDQCPTAQFKIERANQAKRNDFEQAEAVLREETS